MKIIFSALFLYFLTVSPLPAAEIFAGSGASPDPALALSQASADAGSQALWGYISSHLEAERLRENFGLISGDFLAQPGAYIKSSRSLALWRNGGLTRVMAEVELDEAALQAALARLSLPPARQTAGQPLLCLVSELAGPGRPPLYWWSGQAGAAATPAAIANDLKAFGFIPFIPEPGREKTVPAPDALTVERALELGRELKADLLLLGRVRLYPLLDQQAAAALPLVSFSLLKPAENKVLAQVEAEGAVLRPGEEAEALVQREISEALSKLFELAGFKASAPAFARIRLEYQGLRSAAQLARLERLLTLLGGAVVNSHRESMSAGKALLMLDSRIDGRELAERMRSTPEIMKEITISRQSEDLITVTPAGQN
jgi:hypothetical protein